MTISVTHSTAADDTFSAEGALAWDAEHTVSGLGTMAEQNANNVAITGGTVSGTTLTATTSLNSNTLKAVSGSSGGTLQNAAGAACLQWGAGGSTSVIFDDSVTAIAANAIVNLAPTGTGYVSINPATAGSINNMVIGGTTAAAGTFTSLTATLGISGGTF